MMNTFRSCFVLIISIILVFSAGNLLAEVELNPLGVAVSLEADGAEAVEMTFSNDGDSDVSFEISFARPEEERINIRPGPRRDDFGDRIEFYDMPNRGWCGLAWNGEDIMCADYDNQRIYFWNIEDEEFTGNFGVNYFPWGIAFDGEAYWVALDNPTQLRCIDRDGDQLTTLNLNYVPAGVAWDGVNLWTYPYYARNQFILRQITVQGEVLLEIDCAGINGRDSFALTWVPEHESGHMWVISEVATLMQWDLDLENEEVEVVQEVDYNHPGGTYGITHDGENIWYSVYGGGGDGWGFGVVDDGIEEPKWIMAEPREGVISADGEETFELQFNAEGIEAGTYQIQIVIELAEVEERDDLEQTLIEISALMSVDTEVANLFGTVSDAADEEPVIGATISLDRYVISRYSAEEGEYSFEHLPLGDYSLTFTARDYLLLIEEISIEEAGETELNAALLHAECTPSRDLFSIELEPDMSHEFDFEVANDGNGSLTYIVERRLPGHNPDPWELRLEYNAEEIVGDAMLNGVVFAEDHFFISGGNDGDDVSKIYKINCDGELVDEFDQFRESRYGMRDLAWDGSLIWGADEGTLYGFTTEGELEREFDCPVDIECRSLAWDPEREVLWASDIATDIHALNREGERVVTFERPEELRIYGLAYWAEDPDDCNLYVFCRGDNTDLIVYKVNLDNGDYSVVAELDVDGGRPGGIQITNQFDIYNWVFVSLVQNPDRIVVWQLEARRDWFQIEPVEGVIEADESEDFVLTLDATGLPVNAEFRGEVVFLHDGVDGETRLDVELCVVEGEVHTTRDIPMEIGWNLVSTNLQPDDEENIRGLVAALVEEELLVIMKNSDGEFYRPDYDFNNIPGWYVDEGYQILVGGDCALTLEGTSVRRDRPITLEAGWQIASYYPPFPIEARVALSGIVDHLIIAKDGRGNFYLPDWDFSNMGDMCEGQGYYLNVDEEIELVYQTGEEANALSGGMRQLSVYDTPGSLPVHTVTGENMSLLVIADIPPLLLQGGSKGGYEIGIYAGDQLVGSGVINNGYCGIAVWGDDLLTNEIDGAIEGQQLKLRVQDYRGLRDVEYVVLAGQGVYSTNSFAVVEIKESVEVPVKFGIAAAYPNPFNGQLRIEFGLEAEGYAVIEAFDLTGRQVDAIVAGDYTPGSYSVTWNAGELSSGFYFIKLAATDRTCVQKVLLIR